MRKEKDKEPDKTEKQEITSYKKKFLEEKKDSDDSDEVTRAGSGGARVHSVYSGTWSVSSNRYLHLFLLPGNQTGCAKTLQEEAEKDEQADCS